jgi:hypothetical protein
MPVVGFIGSPTEANVVYLFSGCQRMLYRHHMLASQLADSIQLLAMPPIAVLGD